MQDSGQAAMHALMEDLARAQERERRSAAVLVSWISLEDQWVWAYGAFGWCSLCQDEVMNNGFAMCLFHPFEQIKQMPAEARAALREWRRDRAEVQSLEKRLTKGGGQGSRKRRGAERQRWPMRRTWRLAGWAVIALYVVAGIIAVMTEGG